MITIGMWTLMLLAHFLVAAPLEYVKSVEPTNTLYFGPCPCEKATAAIRNGLAKAVNEHELVSSLAARNGERDAILAAALYPFIPVYGWAAIVPAIRNARRHRKTKNLGRQALLDRGVPAEFIAQLNNIRHSDMETGLRSLLQKEGLLHVYNYDEKNHAGHFLMASDPSCKCPSPRNVQPQRSHVISSARRNMHPRSVSGGHHGAFTPSQESIDRNTIKRFIGDDARRSGHLVATMV